MTAGDLTSFAVETGRALRGDSTAMLTPAMARVAVGMLKPRSVCNCCT